MQLLHGSGKTAVLVERIIHKIIDENVDIDKILVVTFTNAAASEMRERILNAIYKKIEENPNNTHLQKQITLLNKASICTIHSFCLDIIRNYFYEIDMSANFQIGDSAEMELLKQEVLDDLFEEKYIEKDKGFLELIDIYATYKGDEPLKELILKIENQIQSNPFPKNWLEEKTKMFDLSEKMDEDFSKTVWGKIILNQLSEEFEEAYLRLEKVENNLKKYEELEKYVITIQKDKEKIERIRKILLNESEDTWDKVYAEIANLKFDTWPINKKIEIFYKDEAKNIRDKVKKDINNIIDKSMIYTSKQANEVINNMYTILNNLKDIILEFEERFNKKKREKNRIDFHDIEHLALSILVKQDEEGKVVPTQVAKKLQEKFIEIAIDEYQDSNLIQEYILNSVSKGNNIFMVGDIKQSIYRFRQAMPELFLEKYRNYKKIEENEIETKEQQYGRKIQLFKNFRSREEILNITNFCFSKIMSERLGDVNYNEEEYLNLGANYPKTEKIQPELHILDLKEDTSIWKTESDEQEENVTSNEVIEKNVEEAKIVANRIEELIKEEYEVYDSKNNEMRKIQYKDIAILLRSTANNAPIYEKELISKGFPVFCDTSSEYLETLEIQTIISLLKVIDNPMLDIPFVATLRSPFGNFTDNELVKIRLVDRNCSFYEAFLKARTTVEETLRKKIEKFINKIENWRILEKEKPLDELIWQIYQESNYYNYVGLLSNGNLRQANLKMLFERAKQYETASFKGLYNFINFLNRLKISSKDLSAARIVGENDNVIRIMSIHKSKGLEFPVVFLCNTGKQFNKQDLNDLVLLHQDLGFGPKYIDVKNKIEFPTLAKEAIKIRLENELISEEMRVLYVALTRAKEKLIITGVSKDFQKSLQDKKDTLSLYNQYNKQKLEYTVVKKYMSYLEWFILLIANENIMNLQIHKIDETQEIEEKEEKIEEKQEKIKIDKEELEKLQKELEWGYEFESSCKIPTKTSISKIKEQKQEENIFDIEELISKKQLSSEFREPNFATKEGNVSSSRKGTLMHLCLQKLDSSKEYNEEDIKMMIKELVEREIILEKEAEAISITALNKYLKSDLWKDLKTAKQIYKEKPFYMNVTADRLNKEYSKKDNILVQGIIDLYYINKDNELVLVDYKTDYVQKGEEQKLIDKYKEQLNLYKEALENSLERKVNKVLIYSTWIGEVECNI